MTEITINTDKTIILSPLELSIIETNLEQYIESLEVKEKKMWKKYLDKTFDKVRSLNSLVTSIYISINEEVEE
jgi:hypothetical protein